MNVAIPRRLDRLTNLYEISAVTGAAAPWFKNGHDERMLNPVYPCPGGAYVVEQTLTANARKARLSPGVPRNQAGVFHILHVDLSGVVVRLPDTFNSASGARSAARRISEKHPDPDQER